ncbi:MAG TPA: hypothetical protein DCE44_22075 [Verrucomicrobiales bacterium]|nr:hypothetical protein [Verrucomicrobiales bacterium]
MDADEHRLSGRDMTKGRRIQQDFRSGRGDVVECGGGGSAKLPLWHAGPSSNRLCRNLSLMRRSKAVALLRDATALHKADGFRN